MVPHWVKAGGGGCHSLHQSWNNSLWAIRLLCPFQPSRILYAPWTKDFTSTDRPCFHYYTVNWGKAINKGAPCWCPGLDSIYIKKHFGRQQKCCSSLPCSPPTTPAGFFILLFNYYFSRQWLCHSCRLEVGGGCLPQGEPQFSGSRDGSEPW